MEFLNCLDSAPNLFGIFDTTVAPPLLYYSYIPIVLVSLLFGILVYNKKTQTLLQNKLFFAVAASFSLFIINEIIQWIAVPTALVHFGWELAPLLQISTLLFSIYFVSVFVRQEDINFFHKLLIFILVFPVLILLPTSFNMRSFDLINCESNIGPLFTYVYGLEVTSILFVLFIGLRKFFKTTDKFLKKQFLFVSLGTTFFITLLSASNIFGEIFQTYEINLIGPIGMVFFLGLLTYMIVKYKAFNIKLIATQALMVTLIVLIASQLFFIKSNINFILTGITLAISVVFGGLLIKSVKREVEQREKIQRLATSLADTNKELEVANEKLKELDKQKTEFVSLASHQLRSPLTAIKGYSSMILEGSFGKINEKAKEAIARVFESSQKLVLVIEDFLNVTRIELGRMKYDMTEFDFNKLAKDVMGEQKPNVERRGLAISYEEDAPEHKVYADLGKVSQVISNLIDNSVKYTKKGSITVKVAALKGEDGKDKVRLSVSDTGVGIEPQVMPHLFEKFVRAYDAGKTNIIGTGLGLFVAKQIIDAMGGRIWAESEGKDKGSSFFVELNLSTGVAPIPITPTESATAAPATMANSAEAPIPQPVPGDLS